MNGNVLSVTHVTVDGNGRREEIIYENKELAEKLEQYNKLQKEIQELMSQTQHVEQEE